MVRVHRSLTPDDRLLMRLDREASIEEAHAAFSERRNRVSHQSYDVPPTASLTEIIDCSLDGSLLGIVDDPELEGEDSGDEISDEEYYLFIFGAVPSEEGLESEM